MLKKYRSQSFYRKNKKINKNIKICAVKKSKNCIQ